MAAAKKVFSNYELTEHILLHLPLRRLLLAHRINKTTSDVVTSSLKIRRALFLEASAAPLRSFSNKWRTSEDSENINPVLNPFLTI